jgi:hypothetical protein
MSGAGAQLTLPQIINITTSRITNLERIVNEHIVNNDKKIADAVTKATAEQPRVTAAVVAAAVTPSPVVAEPPTTHTVPAINNENIEELFNRFDLLLNEVVELKDTMLKLQTYTMGVNQVLMEEKIRGIRSIMEPATAPIAPAPAPAPIPIAPIFVTPIHAVVEEVITSAATENDITPTQTVEVAAVEEVTPAPVTLEEVDTHVTETPAPAPTPAQEPVAAVTDVSSNVEPTPAPAPSKKRGRGMDVRV